MKFFDSTGRRKVFHPDSLINVQSSNSMSLHTTDTDLIFTRVLGRYDVPNSWTASQHCWICEKWDFFEFAALKDDLIQIESDNVIKVAPTQESTAAKDESEHGDTEEYTI